MMDDISLAALWELDEPPGRDPAFVLAVLDRLERRRFRIKVARLAPLLIATIVGCSAIAPSVDALLQSDGAALIIAAAFGLALAAKYASGGLAPIR
jgi:hypothetical protein